METTSPTAANTKKRLRPSPAINQSVTDTGGPCKAAAGKKYDFAAHPQVSCSCAQTL